MADLMETYNGLINKANEYVKNYNPNETVDYNDKRLTDVKAEQTQKESEINQTYDNMINNSNKFYQDQIDASKEWAQKQGELQQANTDLAIEQINQQKEQTQKDYTKEQKASYTDYQKQVNDYGVNAEKMAAAGLNNTGYSETSKVSMYNTYQSRVATARDGLNKAILQYNNSIKEAQLANNSKLAEIYSNALQQQLELSLKGFQYKNSLIEAKINQINTNNTRYDNKYQNVLAQINQEIENRRNMYNIYSDAINSDRKLTESVKQFNQEMELKKQQFNEEMKYKRKQAEQEQRRWEKEYALSKTKTYSSTSGSNGLYVKDSEISPEYNNIQEKMDKVYNTLTNDLKTIYKGNSDDFKNKVNEMMESKITSYIQSQYQNGNITRSEAQSLFDRYGY